MKEHEYENCPCGGRRIKGNNPQHSPDKEMRRLLEMVPHHLRGLLAKCPHYNGTENLLAAIEAELATPSSTRLTDEEIKTLCNRYWIPTRPDAFENLPALIREVEARCSAASAINAPHAAIAFWGKAHACRAPETSMSVGADGTWKCLTCGSDWRAQDCKYGAPTDGRDANG